jgi:hypothetical protein
VTGLSSFLNVSNSVGHSEKQQGIKQTEGIKYSCKKLWKRTKIVNNNGTIFKVFTLNAVLSIRNYFSSPVEALS